MYNDVISYQPLEGVKHIKKRPFSYFCLSAEIWDSHGVIVMHIGKGQWAGDEIVSIMSRFLRWKKNGFASFSHLINLSKIRLCGMNSYSSIYPCLFPPSSLVSFWFV